MSDAPAEEKPGKMRTWWHPILAGQLRALLGTHFFLQEEVPLGRKPIQVDLLLIRREDGLLREKDRKALAGLLERLNVITLVEFKSPSDTLRAGDFQTLLAYLYLYRVQNEPMCQPCDQSVLVIAPRLSGPYRAEAELLGVAVREQEPGVWLMHGGALGGHTGWLVETDTLGDGDHPIATLVSREMLRDPAAVYRRLTELGYNQLCVYMVQQLTRFKNQGTEFAMLHLGAELEMTEVLGKLLEAMGPEERVRGLSPEERVRGLSVDELVASLSANDLARLRDALNRRERGDPS